MNKGHIFFERDDEHNLIGVSAACIDSEGNFQSYAHSISKDFGYNDALIELDNWADCYAVDHFYSSEEDEKYFYRYISGVGDDIRYIPEFTLLNVKECISELEEQDRTLVVRNKANYMPVLNHLLKLMKSLKDNNMVLVYHEVCKNSDNNFGIKKIKRTADDIKNIARALYEIDKSEEVPIAKADGVFLDTPEFNI